jgi:hypothetical protein
MDLKTFIVLDDENVSPLRKKKKKKNIRVEDPSYFECSVSAVIVEIRNKLKAGWEFQFDGCLTIVMIKGNEKLTITLSQNELKEVKDVFDENYFKQNGSLIPL